MLGKSKKKAKTEVATQEQEQQQTQVTNATAAVAAAQQPAEQVPTNQTQDLNASAVNGTQPAADPNAAAMPTGQVDNKTRVRQPLKSYKYTIINGVGKKEKGSFDAESEDDVRNFLLSQEYQVLEVKERGKGDIDIGMNSPIGANDLSFSLTQLST